MDGAGANPLSPARNKQITSDSCASLCDFDALSNIKGHHVAKRLSVSPLCKSFCDSLRVAPGELKFAEGVHSSLTQTVEILSARVRYLEELVESYRKELAGVTDLRIALRVKEIECCDLVMTLSIKF